MIKIKKGMLVGHPFFYFNLLLKTKVLESSVFKIAGQIDIKFI